MLINWTTIIKLPVETRSGVVLGKVYDCELETAGGGIVLYKVRSHLLGGRHYLLKPLQIKEISTSKIIVDDGLIEETEGKPEKKISDPTPALGGTFTIINEK
jgi:hypothetical protein